MSRKRFISHFALVAALAVCAGCASDKSRKPEIAEEDAFTPIRAKYKTVAASEIPTSPEILRVAIIDVEFQGSKAKFSFLPGAYRPRTGFCQLLAEKTTASDIAGLVAALDPYVDRMPFGVIFTYGGRPTSSPEVAESLPPDYAGFFQEFREAMEKEDIEFLCLLPEKVTFLR